MSERYSALCKLAEDRGLIVELGVDMADSAPIKKRVNGETITYREVKWLRVRSGDSKFKVTTLMSSLDDLESATEEALRRVI